MTKQIPRGTETRLSTGEPPKWSGDPRKVLQLDYPSPTKEKPDHNPNDSRPCDVEAPE